MPRNNCSDNTQCLPPPAPALPVGALPPPLPQALLAVVVVVVLCGLLLNEETENGWSVSDGSMPDWMRASGFSIYFINILHTHK